ncbi:YkvA family protein [Demetria terragena]|uniref:YkvA family protein n=1 Tax=Demetria terragena TaxID=63959 RepID=UPI0003657D3E|nr:YkvA family protein [Demetria terragena]
MAPRQMQWSAVRQLSEAVRRASQPGAPSLGMRMSAVPRMVKASVSGEYDGVSPLRVAALAAAAAYVVSPVDLLPEALLSVVGLVDDAVVLAWFASALVSDTDAFLEWERRGKGTIKGQRVR